jgi:mannose-1-phosphate guanylyltransferase
MTSRLTGKNSTNEWAVILAGGDGTRLKTLTRQIAGDDRPKQFCSVLGGATLLEDTQSRVSLEFAKERILYVLDQKHNSYYAPILGSQPNSALVIQPRGAGTAPAILYSLLKVKAADPNAVVAVFPSDHYVSDAKKLMAHIRTALNTAHQKPDRLILIGIEPKSPEVEYGWIEPNYSCRVRPLIYAVTRFWEKPDLVLAQTLQIQGCLWNSFVMVGSARGMLELIERANAELYCAFASVTSLLNTPAEATAMADLYDGLEEIDFSQRVLARFPEQLAVLKVTGMIWSDLGEPKRVLAARAIAGRLSA